MKKGAPDYILNFNKTKAKLTEDEKLAIKMAIFSIITILLGSLAFAFSGRIYPTILFCFLSLGVVITKSPPLRLQFNKDHLTIYKPKRFSKTPKIKKVIAELKYADIEKCILKTDIEIIQLYCNKPDDADENEEYDEYDEYYDLKNNNRRNKKEKKAQKTIYYDIILEPELDFVREFESHTLLKVNVKSV